MIYNHDILVTCLEAYYLLIFEKYLANTCQEKMCNMHIIDELQM